MHTQTKWKHQCFESSFNVMNKLIELGYESCIVHGKCIVEDNMMEHSWVELKDKDFNHQVDDLTLCETNWIEKKEFYKYWNVQETSIYDKEEVEFYLSKNILMLGSESFFKDCIFHNKTEGNK